MTDASVSPLRQRMIEDMTIRKLAPRTQESYIRTVISCRIGAILKPLLKTASQIPGFRGFADTVLVHTKTVDLVREYTYLHSVISWTLKMAKRVALYLRVSTSGQTVANQRRELEAVAERHGWNVVAEFKDEGISGSKGRDQRPGFNRLCQGVNRRDFDMIAAWSVDRLGRSLQDLVSFLADLHSKRVDLYLHQQGLDTSTPSGRAMFQMMGVFAEFERAMIQERVRAGLARARAEGKRLGRPTALTRAKEREIRRLLGKHVGVVKIGRTVGVGTGTVQSIKATLTKIAA
jgi:DNA invertase Pin-like site-specific DNA recombinase